MTELDRLAPPIRREAGSRDTVERVNLVELGQGVFAFTNPEVGFGYSNIGLIIDADGLTMIDSASTPEAAHATRRAVLELTAELDLPIKRVTLSSSRIPFSGGSWAFWKAAFYGSEATSDQLDAPLNRDALVRLLPQFAEAFHEEFETRPITHTIEENVWITPAAVAVPLAGESPMNLVVQAPASNVVYAGALASFGVTPLAFDGNPAQWADSLDVIAELGATVVPGHGPPGGAQDLADLRDYLRACVAVDGDVSALPSGPWDDWTDRRFDAVNVERAARLARGDTDPPQAMFELLGLA